MTVVWDSVTRDDVMRAISEYDGQGPTAFFSAHGFGPTTTYDLLWNERPYPPKAILGAAYEFATGQRLAATDFEGGKTGAVKILTRLGFMVQPREPRCSPHLLDRAGRYWWRMPPSGHPPGVNLELSPARLHDHGSFAPAIGANDP